MCIIIAAPKNVTLKRKTLLNCWLGNNDGGGFAYVTDEGLQIFKELESFEKFYGEYIRIKELYPKSNMLIHMRIATHGSVIEENCHPFYVNKDLVFAHNGIIREIDIPKNRDVSDTVMFNETILQGLEKGFEKKESVRKLLENFIGYSKLCFLTSDNEFYFANEEKGISENGCWFSNTSFRNTTYTLSNYKYFDGVLHKREDKKKVETMGADGRFPSYIEEDGTKMIWDAKQVMYVKENIGGVKKLLGMGITTKEESLGDKINKRLGIDTEDRQTNFFDDVMYDEDVCCFNCHNSMLYEEHQGKMQPIVCERCLDKWAMPKDEKCSRCKCSIQTPEEIEFALCYECFNRYIDL